MKPSIQKPTVDLFSALGNPQRALLVEFCMKENETTLCDLLQNFSDVPRSTLTHHVNTLVDAGVLSSTKSGREVRISLNRSFIQKQLKRFGELMATSP